MINYKLEQHLKELCDQNERYLNLYSTWVLNKRTCSDLLKNVVVHYPHFSMHDASHADAVLSKMEMLLGERVRNLSPTDTWLLLHAAYAHDLGMVVEWEALEARWAEPDFQEELSYLETLQDEDLCKAVEFVRQTHELTKEQTWPLEASRYVRLINAALFRGKHAQMSESYIDFTAPELGLDIGHNNLIQPRLVKLLGQICQLHTEPLDKILQLDYETNGFDADYAHPRFAAMMLQLGDLLDVDNGRFNTGAEAVSGGLPQISIPHREKHEATTHLLVTPKEISFRSDCPDTEAYREARNFVSWLEQEVDFLTKNWAKIVPEDLGGYAPRFDNKRLLIKGVPDIQGVAGLRFEISQDKAFQMMEGGNIYSNSLAFLREVLQNAEDASKLQLWEDLCSQTYQAWMGAMDEEHLQKLQPYEIPEKVYENYPITVNVSAMGEDGLRIEISDRGTGISVESFKQMCHVGQSNESSKRLRDTIRKMPNWLRPTAGFGIGLQSIFLVTDQFTIDTSTGQEAFHAVVYSKRKGGYLQLQRANRSTPRGTTISIETKKLDYLRNGRTHSHAAINFDPLYDENRICEARIIAQIYETCVNSIFSIGVQCPRDKMERSKTIKKLPVIEIKGWESWKDRYRWKLEEDSSKFSLWDKCEAVLQEFFFPPNNELDSGIGFKGMEVEKYVNYLRGVLSSHMDIYGLDTKKTVTLDRARFTTAGHRKIWELRRQYMKVFGDIMLQKLQSESFQLGGKFDLYSFWLNCNEEQRVRFPEKWIRKIPDSVAAFQKMEDGMYHKIQKPVRELIPVIEKSSYVDVTDFRPFKGTVGGLDYDKMCSILNGSNASLKDCFVVDEDLLEAVDDFCYIKSVNIIGENPGLIYYTWHNKPTPIKASKQVRRKVLLSLREQSDAWYTNDFVIRYATFAIEGYEILAIKSLPYYMNRPARWNSAWMISPFVREDEERRRQEHWSKETFAAQVMASEMFPRVVDWVEQHSIHENPPSRQEIIEAYKKLMYEYCAVAEEADKQKDEATDV